MAKLDGKVYCRSCNKNTNHNILHSHREIMNDYDLPEFIIDHSIIQCAGCDTFTYADIFSGDYVDEEIEKHGYDYEKQVELYPEKPKVKDGISPKFDIQYFMNGPKNISSVYVELISSYNKGHNILCALGLRTLIEAVCNELNITKGYKYDADGNPLSSEGKKESKEGQINGLFENQHINWYQTLILQRIREIGNAAAHELITPTSEELHSAIRIVESLIENIYLLKDHDLLKK